MATYLYIKQHSNTGLKYFGKSTRSEKGMLKYNGSGLHWKRHIKKHGSQVVTIWYYLFENEKECSEFALFFSEILDIVNSPDWANLIVENGMSGAPTGSVISQERRDKIKKSRTGKALGPQSKETCLKKSLAMMGKNTGPHTTEHKLKNSNSKKGIPRIPFTAEHRLKISISNLGKCREWLICPHCGKEGRAAGMRRWHFKNCSNQ